MASFLVIGGPSGILIPIRTVFSLRAADDDTVPAQVT
jgi:hypothetical protein